MAFLGIDIGTSGCKVCTYNRRGDMQSCASQKYQELRGSNTREIEPDVIREKVFLAFSEAVSACAEPIQAIAVTCLGESLVCLDENETVLCNSMVTGDHRGADGVEKVCRELGNDYVFQVTGLMPSQLYSLPKLIHLQKNTDVLRNAKKMFFYEDYIGYLLTGERKVSFSSAARSMAFDIHSLKWDEKLLATAGLKPEHFSEPVPSGTIIGYVKPEIAEKYHLTGKIPVVAGGHDQATAALGSGFMDTVLGEDCIGTCECLALMLPDAYDRTVLQKLQMPCMLYLLPNTCFTTFEVTTCGALMNWGQDVLLKGTKEMCEKEGLNFFKYMDERVAGKHTDVLILPQFGSSGHPDLNLNHMTGTITGLTLDTTEEDLYLALKESMVFQLRLAHEAAVSLDMDFQKLVTAGGASSSAVTSQLRADIFRKPVYTLANSEAGTLGCMILAAAAVGEYPDIVSCVREVVRYSKETLPNPENFGHYEKKYQQYKRLYKKMHQL